MGGTSAPKEVVQRIERQIAAPDKQIDQVVHELYGLMEEEIRMVLELIA
jgi:hypothetical protein